MNDKVEDKGQGRVVILPNGEKRIDFIRDSYYTDGVHNDETDMSRSAIKTAINDMLEKAGREGEQIPYQIVFAATKTSEDPRIAAAAAKAAKAEAKAEKEKVAAAEKEAADKAKAKDKK